MLRKINVFKQLKSEERQWIADKKNEMMIKKYNKSGGRKKRSYSIPLSCKASRTACTQGE